MEKEAKLHRQPFCSSIKTKFSRFLLSSVFLGSMSFNSYNAYSQEKPNQPFLHDSPAYASKLKKLLLNVDEKKRGKDVEKLLSLCDEKGFSENQKLKFLDVIIALTDKKKGGSINVIYGIESFIKNASFKPNMIYSIEYAIKVSNGDSSMRNNALECFEIFLSNKNFKDESFDYELINKTISLIKLVSDKAGDNGYFALSALKHFFSNQNFKPQTLNANFGKQLVSVIKRVSRNTGDKFSDYSWFLASLLSNPDVKQSNLNNEFADQVSEVILFYAKKVGQDRVLSSTIRNMGNESDLLCGMAENPNLKMGMLHAGLVNKIYSVASFVATNSNYKEQALMVLQNAFSSSGLKPQMLNSQFSKNLTELLNLAFKNNSKQDREALTWEIGTIINIPEFKLETLVSARPFFESSEINTDWKVSVLRAMSKNPNFKSEFQKPEFWKNLTALVVFTHSLDKPLAVLSGTVSSLFSNENFKPEMLGLVSDIISQNPSKAHSLILALNSLLSNDGLRPELSKKEFVKKLCDLVVSVSADGLPQTSASASLGGLLKNPHFTEAFMDYTKYLSETRGARIDEAFSALFALLKGPEFTSDMFNKGTELAKSMGLDYNNPVIYMNMAYAVANIGEEKARKLHSSLGIEYFARYSKKTLEEIYQNMDTSYAASKPFLLAVFGKSDWNGAFYSDRERLEKLIKYYKLLVVELDSEDTFFATVPNVVKLYGKINTMILAGHGEPGSITFGAETEKGSLDLSDISELFQIRESFVENSTVILESCSTGKDKWSIAGLFTGLWWARVFAPGVPSGVTDFNLDKDGKLLSVVYSEQTREFTPPIMK